MSKKAIVGVILIILVLIGMRTVLFTVDETKQAIIVQLGKYIRTVKEPGLHFKMPLVQTVHRFENRILEYDAAAAKVITADKKHLVVDNYARWKI
ncbi:MAG: protease modulator HflC, partial [Proteobacteria bacterium]|nr:protease modulator HflC [Pseudomonadota bacterium]